MRQRTPARVAASAPMISDELASTEQRFRAAEHDVERASAALKKELRLVDLVGIQILNIVGLSLMFRAYADSAKERVAESAYPLPSAYRTMSETAPDLRRSPHA